MRLRFYQRKADLLYQNFLMKAVSRVHWLESGLKAYFLLFLALIFLYVVYLGSTPVTNAVAGLPEDMLVTGDVEAGTIIAEYEPSQHDALTWVLPFTLNDASIATVRALYASPGVQRMGVYIGQKGAQAEQGFYLEGTIGGLEARFMIGDDGQQGSAWEDWQRRPYGWKTADASPVMAFAAHTRMSGERAGQKHELRLQFNFHNDGAGHTRARALIDGHPIRANGAHARLTDADGWFTLPPEFVPAVIRLGDELGSAQWGRPRLWPGLRDGEWLPPVQPARVELPADQYWLGDSQITGRAAGLAQSNQTAFHALWESFHDQSWNTSITPMAKGGRGLQGHMEALQALWGRDAEPRPGPEWVHIVESGDQNEPGQQTPRQYGDTLVTFMRWLKRASPDAIVSVETPFSFGRESVLFDEGRDWTAHRTELLARVETLKKEGIRVHVVDTDHRIRALERKLGPEAVWYQPGTPAQYHFTEVGNLMTALTIYWHLGYDVNAINFQPILDEGMITQSQIDACLSVLNAAYP